MPIDPKITARLPATLPTTNTPRPVAPQPQTVQPQPARSTGYQANSTFQPARPLLTTRNGGSDDSIGRGSKAGGADDSIGRGSKKGGSDDSIGRTGGKGGSDDGIGRSGGKGGSDDGIGRTKGKGGSDDGIGRTGGKGGSDDSIGDLESVRLALVGRTDTPDANALRNAIHNRLETPSFLKGSESAAAQVFNFARSKLGLSATQVGQLTTVLKGAANETAKLVGALCEKCPEALTNVDSKGQTLLANLAKLASQPMSPLLSGETTRGELMSSVRRDVVNPNRIDQGDAPTCTVTSMQFELVADEPAEYVRLMTDLSGPQGRARMRGQSELVLQPGDASVREQRSISQTIFQTVTMEYGNGRSLEFDPKAGGSLDANGTLLQRGLKPEQQTQVLRQLFGVNYRSERFQTEAEGARVLEKLRNFDSRSAQNRPILLQIDQGSFNHAVTFERVSDNKVFFRDPYGELRSMPENQFKTFVVGLHAPKDSNIVN
jgi:hypothetical protein